jgi:hypothetical protein
MEISFSPDGREIAFSALGDDGTPSIWVATLDHSSAARMLQNAADDPRFTPAFIYYRKRAPAGGGARNHAQTQRMLLPDTLGLLIAGTWSSAHSLHLSSKFNTGEPWEFTKHRLGAARRSESVQCSTTSSGKSIYVVVKPVCAQMFGVINSFQSRGAGSGFAMKIAPENSDSVSIGVSRAQRIDKSASVILALRRGNDSHSVTRGIADDSVLYRLQVH